MKPLEVLGLDLGEVKTGVARGNTAAGLAEPLATIPTKSIFEKIDKLVSESSISEIVVGLPRNLEGHDTAQTTWVRDWVAKAKPKLKTPIFWQDEALTSKQVEGYDKSHGTDAAAAALILQDYFDSPKDQRVRA